MICWKHSSSPGVYLDNDKVERIDHQKSWKRRKCHDKIQAACIMHWAEMMATIIIMVSSSLHIKLHMRVLEILQWEYSLHCSKNEQTVCWPHGHSPVIQNQVQLLDTLAWPQENNSLSTLATRKLIAMPSISTKSCQ